MISNNCGRLRGSKYFHMVSWLACIDVDLWDGRRVRGIWSSFDFINTGQHVTNILTIVTIILSPLILANIGKTAGLRVVSLSQHQKDQVLIRVCWLLALSLQYEVRRPIMKCFSH